MRHSVIFTLCLGGALTLSACGQTSTDAEIEAALKDVNVIDESNLNDVMLASSDANEAVAYFARSSAQEPDRIDLKRGLAKSLVRASKPAEAVPVWRDIVASDEANDQDRLDLAEALIRSNQWDEAEVELDKIPPTTETYDRYRMEAMVADANEEWEKADSFYETALGLTTKPSSVLNNWGYSKLTRGDAKGAETLFAEAVNYAPDLFTAKNNLVLARGAQRNYDLPVVEMSQTEQAQLLHTLALSAIKQGDVATGRGLLRQAMDTHPQHFEAAARSLDALENNVVN